MLGGDVVAERARHGEVAGPARGRGHRDVAVVVAERRGDGGLGVVAKRQPRVLADGRARELPGGELAQREVGAEAAGRGHQHRGEVERHRRARLRLVVRAVRVGRRRARDGAVQLQVRVAERGLVAVEGEVHRGVGAHLRPQHHRLRAPEVVPQPVRGVARRLRVLGADVAPRVDRERRLLHDADLQADALRLARRDALLKLQLRVLEGVDVDLDRLEDPQRAQPLLRALQLVQQVAGRGGEVGGARGAPDDPALGAGVARDLHVDELDGRAHHRPHHLRVAHRRAGCCSGAPGGGGQRGGERLGDGEQGGLGLGAAGRLQEV